MLCLTYIETAERYIQSRAPCDEAHGPDSASHGDKDRQMYNGATHTSYKRLFVTTVLQIEQKHRTLRTALKRLQPTMGQGWEVIKQQHMHLQDE